ncbi:GNAT family N-acetyltransferase [Arenicella xantha]|uniref:Ribosomal protein S18 acetylase RimI-like enzyme n=1 Tax=Arenicella xantha TaxID=644221 RepID=A0A395JI72_9GAMM|nr:GNAT family N-acetyltransferase [Arenicella xantha]RBP49383.1 ribosomal protein S18 acetylase RimI-like enzyme [Arenicella xantha]
MTTPHIRPVTPADIPQILQFIHDLALYEKEPEAVIATEQHLQRVLFGASPKVFGLIAEIDSKAVGFAIYFFSFSTWLGRHGIYLEDLYVKPETRGSGVGKSLLQSLAKIAVENDCGRVEWSVLNWNEPAIKFYQAIGAKPQDEWTVYRLTDSALTDFAKSD